MIFACCLLASSGSRLKTMFFLLFATVAVSHIRPLRVGVLIRWAYIAIFVLVVQTLVLGRMKGTDSMVGNLVMSANRVVERVFMTKGWGSQEVFHYIPQLSPYRHGETMLASLVGRFGNALPFSHEMYAYLHGTVGAGTAGPQSFAEGYVNFGLPGLLAVAFLLGMFIQRATVYFIRAGRRDSLRLVFTAYVVVLLARTGYGGTLTFKTNGIHVLLLLWLAVSLLRNVLPGQLGVRRCRSHGQPTGGFVPHRGGYESERAGMGQHHSAARSERPT